MKGKKTKIIIGSSYRKYLIPHLEQLKDKSIKENDCDPKICSFTITNLQ